MPADITKVFKDTLKDLADQAQAQHVAHSTGLPADWQLPANFSGDPSDPEVLGPAFDRTEIDTQYLRVMNQTGSTVGEAGGLKRQTDYVASVERAMSCRHLTLCRAASMAAARRLGHANGLFQQIEKDTADLLAGRT